MFYTNSEIFTYCAFLGVERQLTYILQYNRYVIFTNVEQIIFLTLPTIGK